MTQLVEAEGRGFDSRWRHWNFPLTNLPALGSTQSLTEMSKRQSSPVTGQEGPRGFQKVKVPRLRDNGTGWW